MPTEGPKYPFSINLETPVFRYSIFILKLRARVVSADVFVCGEREGY